MSSEMKLNPERDLAAIIAAVGGVPRVSYEAAHVYPLSAPDFVSKPGAVRQHPDPGPLKLYLHIPFCNYACSFCFYVKRIGSQRDEMERYLQAVERELEWVEPGTPLEQLYVGGGTPTALPPDLFDRALRAVFDRMPRQSGASATVECSPESISADHVSVLKERGVERVSMGIESLDEQILDTLRRRHGSATALEACDLLLGAGLYLNVDLIYGLPGQTHESFGRDLERVAAQGVDSISVYNLRLNERTPVATAVKEMERMDLEVLIGWRAFVERSAKALGFDQKRWHTFVRRGSDPKSFSRAPCGEGFGLGRQLGVGVSSLSHLGHEIYRNDDKFGSYLARIERGESPVNQVFALEPNDRKTLLVARTLGDGSEIDRRDYADAVGRTVDEDFGALLDRLRRASLIDDDGERVALSEDGRLVYDLVTLSFYPEHARRWLDERQQTAASRA
jgi:oxygen-independent coproporphyrinogen-3 oxidase